MSSEQTKSGKEQLKEWDKITNNPNQRDFEGSLESQKEMLRDAYMNFKDLQNRCTIDIRKKNQMNFGENESESQVYYFKPETFLLDDPEKQRAYRESLLKKVGQVPKPEPLSYLGDQIHRSFCQSIADRSTPSQTKTQLYHFYKQRQYTLQHQKYKLLCRWAHHNLTSEKLENLNSEATFLYGKLAFNHEQAVQRADRLRLDDQFDLAVPSNRPSTKQKEGGSALYVERSDQPAQSLLREDDIEVYIRQVSHRNKVGRVMNKYVSRLKWLALHKKYDIFEKAIQAYFQVKEQNIKAQQKLLQKVQEKAKRGVVSLSAEQSKELDQVVQSYYCKRYEKMFSSFVDRTLHQWRGNHDETPLLVSDPFLLKLKITELASHLHINGDIDLDNGFSYSYQVSVLFPNQFQALILRSEFSIYDEGAGDKEVEGKKQTLTMMAKADTNIFTDISTTKGVSAPSQQSLQADIKNLDIKVHRLRSSSHWLSYICLKATETDWHQKQQAVLNCDTKIDSLLKSGMNFLDVNDLATINRVNEDNATRHIILVHKLSGQMNQHDRVSKQQNPSAGDGPDAFIYIDQLPQYQSLNKAGNMEQHLLSAVQDPVEEEDNNVKQFVKLNQFNTLPTHLMNTYYTLRYVKSRDAKVRILYTLNYFRTIQKRLALDLREFATRDRLNGHQATPFVPAKEANQNIVNQTGFSAKAFEKVAQSNVESESKPNMTVFDEKAIKEIKNQASLRSYKKNGLFNNRVFSTCPSYPKFHMTHGEPIELEPFEEESKPNMSITERAMKLLGRIEKIELNEVKQEVYVKDDYGIYCMHDCTLQDMKHFEQELIKIGSYFIHKSEVLVDPTVARDRNSAKQYPYRDRLELLNDLLNYEAEFQFHKVKLTQVYMECYEHITSPLEQQKIMQTITDLMARRPRLNLEANYFKDAYEQEIECLKKQFDLTKRLVDLQISLEKAENERLQKALFLSYQLADQYSKNRWQYSDAEALLKAFLDKEKGCDECSHIEKEAESIHSKVSKQSKAKHQSESNSDKNLQEEGRSNSPSAEDNISSAASLTEADYGEQNTAKFAQLLGLPKVSIDTIYQNYKEKNRDVIKLMQEHSHFIAMHEGYPEFLTRLTHRSLTDKYRTFRVNKWSQETGTLDFYESLDFINSFYAVSMSCKQELYEGFNMWDNSLLTQIDIQFYHEATESLHELLKMQENALEEYKGREYVEDESILGSSDKQIFYAKEMTADLNFKPKNKVCPFIISKLDIPSITFFEFPKIPQSQNKYLMLKKGIQGLDYLVETEKRCVIGVGKEKADDLKKNGFEEVLQEKVVDVLQRRNIKVPSLLQTYCNMVELHRLRNEIILAVSETAVLQKVYIQQCEQTGQKNVRVGNSEGINFDQIESVSSDEKLVNFSDDGCAHMLSISLAIKEFDPTLLSNFNFRSPDAFKLNILSSGIEEVRAILQAQLLHKYCLIVACRLNQLLIDTSVRAKSELSLLSNHKIAIPNSIVDYNKLINKNFDTIPPGVIPLELTHYSQNLSSIIQPVMYNVFNKKNQSRATLAKEFSTFQTKVQQEYPHNEQTVIRIMRSFKVKLLTKYVSNILSEICLDAQKVNAIHSCQRLRHFNRIFEFNCETLGLKGITEEQHKPLKYETSQMIENWSSHYLPSEWKDEKKKSDLSSKKQAEIMKSINSADYEISNHWVIPSSITLMQLDTSNIYDVRKFKEKKKSFTKKRFGTDIVDDIMRDELVKESEPEQHIKQLLPTFTPDENIEQTIRDQKGYEGADEEIRKRVGSSATGLLDYEEALYFGDSKFASMIRFYQLLERVLQLEWFILKLQFPADDIVQMDQAIESGSLWWGFDDFTQRVQSQMPKTVKEDQINFRLQDYIAERINQQRSKRNIAEQVVSMAQTVKNFILQYNKTKVEDKFEYITQYCEFRYQQVVGSMHQLVQQFYRQGNINAVQVLRQAVSDVTKMNHTSMSFLRPGNYTIQNCVAQHSQYSIEAGNMVFGPLQQDDILNFDRCVQPVINERALEPSQVSLFVAMYNFDYLRRSFRGQFVGQWCSYSGIYPFHALTNALLMLSKEERAYSQSFIVQAKYQANDFMETIFNDDSLSTMSKEEAYTLHQLKDAQKFINESTQAILLRNALICWFENSPLPSTIEQYQKFEENFRDHFFWKQMDYKEELKKRLGNQSAMGSVPSNSEIKKLQKRIDDLCNDQSLPTHSEVQRRDELVKALRAEFKSLKKKVTFDHYFNTKAEINVFGNEIEKFMIKASILTLDNEHLALANCFKLQVPTIQYHIHPFQQFAATFFDQVNPNAHLDVSNKINAIQLFLTRLRNRGTQVETLTSGPGMVFTVKDMNETMQDFCRSIIKEQEQQFKARNEHFYQVQEIMQQLLYEKDQKIHGLENRIKRILNNLDSIIDARLYEKGNQMIYELDSSQRVLSLFKQSIYDLEQKLVARIHGEQLEKFERIKNKKALKDIKFDKYKETVMNKINENFVEDMERIKKIIHEKAERAKNTEEGAAKNNVQLYPCQPTSQQQQQQQLGQTPDELISLISGSIVPKGWQHYQFCSCYQPMPGCPTPTFELAELELLSEKDARRELSSMCVLLRKQRIMNQTKLMLQASKYQKQITHLKKQMENNSYLWDMLAEKEKVEKVLKQELLHTQQQLSSSEKRIIQLSDENKQLDAERSRLLNYKTSRQEKFVELEQKCQKYDLMSNVDTDQLIVALQTQQHKLDQSTKLNHQFNKRLELETIRQLKERKTLSHRLQAEQEQKQIVVEKMEQMKIELKMLETSDSSVAAIWKKKCLDLFEVCQTVKKENEELRDRCQELILQGIQLAETVDATTHHSQPPELVRELSPHFSRNKGYFSTLSGALSGKNKASSSGIRSGSTFVTPQPPTGMLTIDSQKAAMIQVNSQTSQENMLQNNSLNYRSKPQTHQRNRTIEQLDSAANSSSKFNPKRQDIRSILSQDSKSFNISRNTEQQSRRNNNFNQTQPQIRQVVTQGSKRRNNYMAQQINVAQQDSIFNQSQVTYAQRNIATADQSFRQRYNNQQRVAAHHNLGSLDQTLNTYQENKNQLIGNSKPLIDRKSKQVGEKDSNRSYNLTGLKHEVTHEAPSSPIAVHNGGAFDDNNNNGLASETKTVSNSKLLNQPESFDDSSQK